MTLNELEFEIIENGSSNLNLINDFFETIEEPVPTGRIYKGTKYSHEFSLKHDLVSSEIIHEDENYLVGFPPDCSRHMFTKMLSYNSVDKSRKRFKNLADCVSEEYMRGGLYEYY